MKFVLLVAVLVDAPVVAAVPLTVSAPPVGAVVSLTKVSEVLVPLPATSLPVIVYEPGPAGLAVHENVLDVYGPPDGVVTVSAACVQPVVAIFGNAADAGPDPESDTVSTSFNEPAAFPL